MAWQGVGNGLKDSTVKLLNEKGERLMYISPDSAIFYSQRAFDKALQSGDTAGQIFALGNLGRVYYIKGSYDQCLRYSTRALDMAQMVSDLSRMSLAYNDIGLVYLGHEQYDLALKEFLRAIQTADSARDPGNISAYLFNAGICYDHRKEYDKAIDFLNKARVNDKDTRVAVMAINRLGETYLHTKEYDRAAGYYRQVLADKRAREDHWEKAFAYAGLAQVAFARRQYDSSIVYAGQSLQSAGRISAKWDEERALKILSESYAGLHQYKKAYEYQLLDKLYGDSLYTESREEVVSYLKLQQQEKQNVKWQIKSDADKKVIQLRTVLLVVTSLLVLLLVFIILFMYRSFVNKHRLNESLMASNRLKDQLFSVVSHDLRGPMNAIQQMLELIHKRDTPEAERNKAYDLFYKQVILSNSMLDNLLQWVNSQRSGTGIVTKREPVDLSLLIMEVLAVYQFLAQQKKIEICNRVSPGFILPGDKEQLRIVLQNIIGNAIKFTRPGGVIQLYETRMENTITLHVKDDGVGIATEKLAALSNSSGPSGSTYGTASEKGTGLGLQLVRQFVDQNGGTFSLLSEEGRGTDACISFSISDVQG